MNIKNKILILIVLILFPLSVNATGNLKEEYQYKLYKAKVIEVTETIVIGETEVQVLKIEILDKEYRGTKVLIRNTLTSNGYDIKLKKNDYISVHAEFSDGEASFYFYSYNKSRSLTLLVILFICSIIIFGGLKGLKALIALILTFALIIFGLVPLLLQGYNPIILSILTCITASVLTFVITNGFTKKTLVAIIGVTGGLIIGGFIAYIFGIASKITGFSTENAQMLQYIPSGISFDFKGLLFAGIIIGALGACMDVAIEITSSLIEIKKHQPKISDHDLIKSGLNIGRDIMGTMVNTLILAYTGGSLATILIFVGFEKSFAEIINLDSIATEIVRAIAGSMGLLFAIPVTIFAFIIIFNHRGEKIEENT